MPDSFQSNNRVECDNCAMFTFCSPMMLGDTEFDVVGEIVGRNRLIKRGEFLYRQGEPFKSIFAICTGSVKVSSSDGDCTEEHIQGFYFPGELVGANAISLKHYPTNAIALSGTRVCELPFGQVEELSKHIPGLQDKIIGLMSNEILQLQQMTSLLTGKKTAEQQLAAFLLDVSLRHKQHGLPGDKIRLRMTRTEIGDYFGLAMETVSRVLIRFQKEQLLEINGSNVEIFDPDRLRRIANAF